MSTYYSTIFLAVLTLFGLQLAALFYVAQVVQARFTTSRTQKLLTGDHARMFWGSALITLATSGWALFVDAFRESLLGRFFAPHIALARWGIVPFASLIVTLLLFAFVIHKYSTYLSPSVAVAEIAKDLAPTAIRNIAIFRLDMQGPSVLSYESVLRDARELQAAKALELEQEEGDATTKSQTLLLLFEREKSREAASHTTEQMEQIKREMQSQAVAGKLKDPLLELREVSLTMLRERNFYVWQKIQSLLRDALISAIKTCLPSEKNALPFGGDVLLCEILEDLWKEASANSRSLYSAEIVETSYQVMRCLLQKGEETRAESFVELLVEMADNSLTQHDQAVFNAALNRLTDTATEFTGLRQTRDEIVRKIGWLAERLLKRGLDETTRIPNRRVTREFDVILNSISRVTGVFNHSAEIIYPDVLIYVIEVIADGVINLKNASDHESAVVGLLGDLNDLTTTLLSRKDERAEFALNRQLTYFSGLANRDLSSFRELEKDLYTWVRELLSIVLEDNRFLTRLTYGLLDGKRDYAGLVLKYLKQMPNREALAEEMGELLIKTSNQDAVNQFLARARSVLGTDFGLHFDED